MLKLRSREFQYSIFNKFAGILPTKSPSFRTTCMETIPSFMLLRLIGKRSITMVSTTRGVPSTSNDLKEALCEKIPLHYDLIRNLRSRYGASVVSQITVDDIYNGLRGVRTGVRETTEIDQRNGLRYRGLTIPEVLGILPRRGNAPSPEAVFWLLLTGDVPTHEQTASLINEWNSRRLKRKNLWLDCGDGAFVGKIIQALPKNLGPLAKLSIALTTIENPEKHVFESSRSKIMSYNDWEQTYEEGMEFLAILPAIVGLVRKNGENIKGESEENGDWVDFFLHCASKASADSINEKKVSLGEFLRLYIAANADEQGGIPSTHITEILGASRMELNKALASGVLAYFREPSSGTMLQCMEFQLKIQSILGEDTNEEALRNFFNTLYDKDNEVVGYKNSAVADPRYNAFLNFANESLKEDPRIKLSKDISRIFSTMEKTTDGKKFWPQQNCLAAPIFQYYGLDNMEFNQVLLCMSRALGAVASIICRRALDIPVEYPKTQSTYSYLESFGDFRKNKTKRTKVKYIKHRKDVPSFFSVDR